jgi:hypothetical protein
MSNYVEFRKILYGGVVNCLVNTVYMIGGVGRNLIWGNTPG